MSEPANPQMLCVDATLHPTVCGEDLADYIDALRAWGKKLNNKLAEIAGLQPTSTP